jgi:hypothetical protein
MGGEPRQPSWKKIERPPPSSGLSIFADWFLASIFALPLSRKRSIFLGSAADAIFN